MYSTTAVGNQKEWASREGEGGPARSEGTSARRGGAHAEYLAAPAFETTKEGCRNREESGEIERARLGGEGSETHDVRAPLERIGIAERRGGKRADILEVGSLQGARA